MQIDLKDPAQFTKNRVRELIASHEDGRHWQLRVTRQGIAYISDVVGNVHCDGLAFWFESWTGTGYVGPQAADDDEWVNSIHDALDWNWPMPTSRYIDNY
ncbi:MULTISPECIES: hypothetical protein [unclassified Achromobacter]|uniref:hypothetical protein n=1 Tax=unclassified Achromobacter TaxID=2626865 RepID=UPI000B5197BC|nr:MULTISPECIES: hypothetical protein [unclassified Achromobacter]OWT75440.1 hypothetical protein CEY04_17795 [Achromobacter sp. HZ28]OWT76100.1 hypothetical protein CEY05_13245 [Achromobacter sp. HZ34]